MTGASLVQSDELFVEDNMLWQKTYSGGKTRIGTLYRRISDEYLDPLTFKRESLIGIPNLMEAYRSGNVAVMNSLGNGVADDKGIYYFVPKMIKYYLGEDAILKNAPTYLPFYDEDREYVLKNIEKLVIKDVAEAGQVIAEILNPLNCDVIARITAPEKSVVFFHIASPLIVEGTVIFKLVKNEIHDTKEE